MSYKRTFLTCTSAIALSIGLAQPGWTAEILDEAVVEQVVVETVTTVQDAAAAVPAEAAAAAQAAPAVAETPAAPAAPVAVEAPAMMAPPPMMEPPAMPEPPALPPEVAERRAETEKRWEARRAELNERYEDLRRRATESGVDLPESAPWNSAPKWVSYDEMRDQMQQRGVEMAKNMPWAPGKGPGRMYMTDEERQAAREAMMKMTSEERDAFREQHYQEMRKRAAEYGRDLPETPPWKLTAEERKALRAERISRMNPEEFDAYRSKKYAKMRDRAAEHGIELPETPPWMQAPAEAPAMPPQPDWKQVRATIEGMSQDEREACALIHRMSMPPMQAPVQQRSMMPEGGYGYGQNPGYGYGPGQGYGRGMGYGRNQGYGGPGGYGWNAEQWPAYQ